MKEQPCPFCKSEKRRIETPYLDKSGQKQYEWCCNAMKRNSTYVKARFDQRSGDIPGVDKISKW